MSASREWPGRGAGGGDGSGPAGTVTGGPQGAVPSGPQGAATGPAGVTGPIRVLIVDDDPLVRAGLSMILRGAPELLLVAEAGDGAQALDAVAVHRPDVVLMDIRMPRMDGLAATEALRRGAHPVEVIVLTTFDADEYVLRALRAGAAGFLLKDTPPAQIVESVRRVAAGEATLSPPVIRKLIDRVTAGDEAGQAAQRRREQARALLDRCPPREREVALAVGRGCSNSEIAAELYMSVATVKAYVSRLLTRLELANRVQIALLVHDAQVSG